MFYLSCSFLFALVLSLCLVCLSLFLFSSLYCSPSFSIIYTFLFRSGKGGLGKGKEKRGVGVGWGVWGLHIILEFMKMQSSWCIANCTLCFRVDITHRELHTGINMSCLIWVCYFIIRRELLPRRLPLASPSPPPSQLPLIKKTYVSLKLHYSLSSNASPRLRIRERFIAKLARAPSRGVATPESPPPYPYDGEGGRGNGSRMAGMS